MKQRSDVANLVTTLMSYEQFWSKLFHSFTDLVEHEEIKGMTMIDRVSRTSYKADSDSLYLFS